MNGIIYQIGHSDYREYMHGKARSGICAGELKPAPLGATHIVHDIY